MIKEPATVSDSRTYIVAIYDIASLNEVRFEKVILPLSWKNTSANARQYFLESKSDLTIRVLACVTFDYYMSVPENEIPLDDPEQIAADLASVDASNTSLEKDMQTVRNLLTNWNNSQKFQGTTYSMIMRSILEQLNSQSEILEKYEELLNLLKKFHGIKNEKERLER